MEEANVRHGKDIQHVDACGNRKTTWSKDGSEEGTILVRPWNMSMEVLSWKGKGQVGPGETTVKNNTRGGKDGERMARRETNGWIT